MSRQDANAAFALTSFLDGGNAAYIEDLYARYLSNPGAVDAEWQAFFQSLKDGHAEVSKAASGPSWRRPNWPQRPQGELVAALTGDWNEVEKAVGDKIKAKAQATGVELSPPHVQQATRDSIHALMLIRAYRARGHFHANLDPLGLEPRNNEEELDPRSYGFTEADMDRPIFLDKVLGLEFATCARSSRSCGAPTARRSASSSCTSPIRRRKPGCRSASRDRTRRSASPARAGARSSTS